MLFKYADNDYNGGMDVIRRVTGYAMDIHKNMAMYSGCRGIMQADPTIAAKQMYATQLIHNYTEGNRLCHLIISFDKHSGVNSEQAMCAAEAAADVIGTMFQTVYSVHVNTDNIHIHFVINAVSCINGEKYKPNTTSLKRYYDAIRQALPNVSLGRIVYDIPI